jgi:hypothetical protein
MKLGVTGTSGLLGRGQERTLWRMLPYAAATEIHHGDCVGADQVCHDIILQSRKIIPRPDEVWLPPVKIIIHPPVDPRKRAFCQGYDEIREPLPYLIRDSAIATESDLLIAIPRAAEEELRSGTWATVRCMRKLKKPVIIIDPDGGWRLDVETRSKPWLKTAGK